MAGGGNDNQPIVTRFDPADRGGEEGGQHPFAVDRNPLDRLCVRMKAPRSSILLSRVGTYQPVHGSFLVSVLFICCWKLPMATSDSTAKIGNHAIHRRYL